MNKVQKELQNMTEQGNESKASDVSDRKKMKHELLLLCRFLSISATLSVMTVLLIVVGILYTLFDTPIFEPYAIALMGLFLPLYLNHRESLGQKKNSDTGLSFLFDRYHYSKESFFSYRISYYCCCGLLFVWYLVLHSPLEFCGLSVPLLFLAGTLFFYPCLTYILYWILHHRLMNGELG